MGRWFPDHRKGSREQVQAFDKASRELNENSDREYREFRARGGRPGWMPGGGMPESRRYLDLNDRAARLEEPLSRAQRTVLARDLRGTGRALRERREQRKAQRGGRSGR
jgi:hypothetical protein